MVSGVLSMKDKGAEGSGAVHEGAVFFAVVKTTRFFGFFLFTMVYFSGKISQLRGPPRGPSEPPNFLLVAHTGAHGD